MRRPTTLLDWTTWAMIAMAVAYLVMAITGGIFLVMGAKLPTWWMWTMPAVGIPTIFGMLVGAFRMAFIVEPRRMREEAEFTKAFGFSPRNLQHLGRRSIGDFLAKTAREIGELAIVQETLPNAKDPETRAYLAELKVRLDKAKKKWAIAHEWLKKVYPEATFEIQWIHFPPYSFRSQ